VSDLPDMPLGPSRYVLLNSLTSNELRWMLTYISGHSPYAFDAAYQCIAKSMLGAHNQAGSSS
jgi:hypothetical protein